MKRVLFAGACASALLALAAPAFAAPEIGPCSDPNAIVVQVGQRAKVCLLLPPIHE